MGPIPSRPSRSSTASARARPELPAALVGPHVVRWTPRALDLTPMRVAAELGYAPDAVPDFVRTRLDELLAAADSRPRPSGDSRSGPLGDSRPRLSMRSMGDSRPRLSESQSFTADSHGRSPEDHGQPTSRLLLAPRGFWRLVPARVQRDAIECHGDSGVIHLRVGPIVASQLRGSSAVAVFVVTVGSAISDQARRAWQSGDALTGCLLDALGSAAAERCAERLAEDVARRCAPLGWHTTHRFSPGYCTWPTDEQGALFTLLPAQQAGVRLTASGMMDPLKSVSGVIGAGPDVRWRPYPCDNCGVKDCTYRAKPHHPHGTDI